MECMLLLLFLSSAIAAEQNLKVLPPPPIYSVGGFTSPNTSTTQVFRPGSQMNVSWYTEYPTVNLYLIYGQNYATPYACIIGTSATWWMWEVDDHGNHTDPFSFRAVNGQGDEDEQRSGGFYTGQFWLAPAEIDLAKSTLTTSMLTTSTLETSSLAKSTLTSSTLATSTLATSTLTASTLVTSSTRAPGTLGSGHSVVTASNTISGTATSSLDINSSMSSHAPTPSSDSSPPGSSNFGIGVGLGVGVGVAAALIGAFVLWRRHQRRLRQEQQATLPSIRNDGIEPKGSPPHWTEPSGETSSSVSSYEIKKQPMQTTVEAPYFPPEPRELSAMHVRSNHELPG